jgi:hypothetical protein
MNTEREHRKLRWFQLGLRDILAIVIICCILLGWWRDRTRLQDAVDRSAEQAEASDAEVLSLLDELVAQQNTLKRALSYLDAAGLPRGNSLGCGVGGLVVAVKPETDVVEINIGSDEGLKAGQTLDVCRTGATLETTKYLGQIRLLSVENTIAFGKIVPEYAAGTIEVNDHVMTRPKEVSRGRFRYRTGAP